MTIHTGHFGDRTIDGRGMAKKLEAASWGTFFIWVAITIVADIHIGIALLGVGVITLAAQGARRAYALRLEGFWLIVGVGFLIGGLSELLDQTFPVLPILLFLAGAGLLVSAFRGPRGEGED